MYKCKRKVIKNKIKNYTAQKYKIKKKKLQPSDEVIIV